jgi:hypothetical protein
MVKRGGSVSAGVYQPDAARGGWQFIIGRRFSTRSCGVLRYARRQRGHVRAALPIRCDCGIPGGQSHFQTGLLLTITFVIFQFVLPACELIFGMGL